jgi:hypothetical protein
MEGIDKSFERRRQLIELLDVWVTLTVEEGQKVAYARCMLGENLLSIASTDSCAGSHNKQKPLVLTARLPLDSAQG